MKVILLVDSPAAHTLAEKLIKSKDGQLIFVTPEEMDAERTGKVIAIRECPDVKIA